MANQSRVLWINDFSGSVNQATAPHLLASNQFKLLVNVDQTEIGAVGHRLGATRFLNQVAGSGQVRGLQMYEKADGNRYLHAALDGDLYYANEVSSVWSQQESGVWSSLSNVDMVNFINRHYMIGSGSTEYLRYTSDVSSSTTIVSGNISGDYLAANGPYLMVVDVANRKAQWSGTATDTFAAADFANINGQATGVGSFGIGRPFVVFTNNNYLVVDPANVLTSEVNGFGCVSHRSIQTVRGHLIYLGRDGFYSLGLNNSYPVEISRVIRNELTKDAIFNKIDGSNWEVVASGVIDDRYFCAVRDLSGNVKGEDLDDVLIEYDIASETFKAHTYTHSGLGSIMARYINNNGDLDLYVGSVDNLAVYKLMTGGTYTDENASGSPESVTAKLVTKDHAFFRATKGVVAMQNLLTLHFKYRASSDLTVKYSLDGNEVYSSLPTTLPATESGITWQYAEVPFGKECKTISLDISGTGEWEIYGIGYEVESLNNTGLELV